VLVWINGAFGAGKTSVATALARCWPEALIFDPEQVGFMLRRVMPEADRAGDFQNLPLWRQLTLQTAIGLIEQCRRPLIVPMTLVDPSYFEEILGGLKRAGVQTYHFTLLASKPTLRRRLGRRLSLPSSKRWAIAQINRCVEALESPFFAVHVTTDERRVADIAAEIFTALPTRFRTQASGQG
jgi:hypothetical protein